MSRRKSIYTSFRKKRFDERVADGLTDFFGTVGFLIANLLFFLTWILANIGWIPGVLMFDPFPFNLLTMVVSLEAIFLSIIVLMSQNKASDRSDFREEIDFRVNVHAEQEVSKILRMLEVIERHLHMRTKTDKELTSMKRKLNIERIAKEVMNERMRM